MTFRATYYGGDGTYQCDIDDMIGRTFLKVINTGDELIFEDEHGRFKFYHSQDCCENVTIEDVVGDLNDLVGVPLMRAEESTSGENPPGVEKGYQESFTWTFYKFATIKGYVDVRWYGSSNGYYSEGVSLSYTGRIPDQLPGDTE